MALVLFFASPIYHHHHEYSLCPWKRTIMTNLFSRDLLIRKPRLNRLQMPQPSRILQIIPEEDETRSSASSSASTSSSPASSVPTSPCTSSSPFHPGCSTGKRTFSTSHIEVSFGDEEEEDNEDDDQLLTAPPRPAPRPPVTPTKRPTTTTSYNTVRFGAASPTPSSSSSSSSGLPSTPTSSDDEFHFPTVRINPRRASIRPLNIIKNNPSGAAAVFKSNLPSFLEPLFDDDDDDDDGVDHEDEESDSEWYTREFSKILSLSSPIPPSFPKLQHLRHQHSQDYMLLAPRPESLLIEPILAEEGITTAAAAATRPPSPPHKRPAISHAHKRSRSVTKEVPPPVPPIPTQFLPPAAAAPMAIPQIIEPPSTRPLSLRRPPPRMSIPDDCIIQDDVVNGAGEGDEMSWPSAFDISSYEHPSPALFPAYISTPAPSPESFLSSPFSLPKIPDSPGSMYSQASAVGALPPISTDDNGGDFLVFGEDEFREIEFGLEDVQFDLSVDTPMRLPLSLPNSPIDLEADFVLGLEELRRGQEEVDVVSPVIAISDVDAQPVFERVLPPLPSEPSSSLPPTPTTATSFDSLYDCNDEETEGDAYSHRPMLRSKWSSSTLASVREEHASSARRRSPIMSTKFAAANKLRLYFGGHKQQKQKQQQQQQQQQHHNRSGSAAAIAAAKAAVARAAAGAIYTPQPYSAVPSAVKKAQRQVVVLPPPPSPSAYTHYHHYHHPRTPPTPKTPMTPTSPTSPKSAAAYSMSPSPSPPPPPHPVSPHWHGGSGKAKARWSRRESDVMVIGYGYNGVGGGKELRRRGSLTPTVSDAGSEESCSSCSSSGLRRKPIPVEMFLRNGATTAMAVVAPVSS